MGATCLLVAEASVKRTRGKARSKARMEKVKARNSKGERVWHVAESEEECGNYSDLYQSHQKPYDLCTEVNVTLNICSTRDTDKVKVSKEEEEMGRTEQTLAVQNPAEPRHEEHDHEHEHEHEKQHKMYTPREDAEWEFKTGTCVFRLHMEKDNSDEDSGEATKKKRVQGGRKMNKSEMKRVQERSKLRKKLRDKRDNGSDKKSRSNRNKKINAPQPRSEA